MPDTEGTEPTDLAIIKNLTLAGFQSRSLLLLGGTEIALAAIAWIWESQWVQVGAVAVMYLLSIWYALNFIPAL